VSCTDNLRFPGHTVIRAPEDDRYRWGCSCGEGLGHTRAGARDVFRFHKLALWMLERESK
jgi:hypothetical protein